MVDPVTAVAGVLIAVGSGMANEAGKRAWETTGALVRRITGREVPAPTTPEQREHVARLVVESAAGRPELLAEFGRLTGGLASPLTGPLGARPRLPSAPHVFTDRRDVMRQLDDEATRPFAGRPRTVQLHGPEGIGTTAVAVHWGWRRADRFPDGQLYADLRGRGPGEGAALLLRELGVPDDRIPPAQADRVTALRSLLDARRLLVVLDHATSTAQVQPLVVTAPGVCTVVVARDRLAGLGAVRVPLGPLPPRDAKRLLTEVAGKPAVAAAKATLPAVLDRCGGHPYALHAAARRLSTVPHAPLEPTVNGANDPVGAAAEDTYRRLSPEAARLYRLAALRPWPALDAPAAAAIIGPRQADADALLEELADALLLDRTGDGRYRYRPGVRAHAERTAAAGDGIAACSAALARALTHYERRAVDAARAALPESWRIPDALPDHSPAPYADRGAALAVLADDAAVLVEAVAAAEESGDVPTALRICRALWPLQLKAGHHETLLPALRAGARLADAQEPGTRMSGALHAQMAHTCTELGRHAEAETEAVAAARAEAAAGHLRGEASAVEFLGLLRLRQWRYPEALERFDAAGAILDGIEPGAEGHADLPRARALLERHRGRALRGAGRHDEALPRLDHALEFFRDRSEGYNTARVLTDLAWTRYEDGERATVLPLIDEALAILVAEGATQHVDALRVLRERCVSGA
ncbi:tetratricopeptide repeat protein [Streptomyces xanthii]|uniref:Tetratricopeptide repeat protein n=1 Tax=Streptomyces xanthii TaxID=2768069 RepID=A0A7H1B387_9ACTN|nr:tetratricopeptide repeat protein [Streptomyces xanthii]QNS03192.1 tetratricopeptide repeat protein [Streptomyces xanthii]